MKEQQQNLIFGITNIGTPYYLITMSVIGKSSGGGRHGFQIRGGRKLGDMSPPSAQKVSFIIYLQLSGTFGYYLP